MESSTLKDNTTATHRTQILNEIFKDASIIRACLSASKTRLKEIVEAELTRRMNH